MYQQPLQTLVRSLPPLPSASSSPLKPTISCPPPPSAPLPPNCPTRHPRLLPSPPTPLATSRTPPPLLPTPARFRRDQRRREMPHAGTANAKHAMYKKVASMLGPLKSPLFRRGETVPPVMCWESTVTSAPYAGIGRGAIPRIAPTGSTFHCNFFMAAKHKTAREGGTCSVAINLGLSTGCGNECASSEVGLIYTLLRRD